MRTNLQPLREKSERFFLSTEARVINNISYLIHLVSSLLNVSDLVIDSLTAHVR
jgi:hypothetical protein